jgi:hypothetical protein
MILYTQLINIFTAKWNEVRFQNYTLYDEEINNLIGVCAIN